MNQFGLKFAVPDKLSDRDAARNFYLPIDGTQGSFETALTPRLGVLGPVNPLNADLARLALLVWAADRSVLRAKGSVNWTSRDLALTVPVSDPAAWAAQTHALEHLLGYLSGDNWTLTFRSARFPKEIAVENPYPTAQRVVLLSGGADSAIGALMARTEPEEHVLFSHHGGNGIAPVQRDVAERIRKLLPNGSAQHHVQLYLARREAQPNGLKFKSSPPPGPGRSFFWPWASPSPQPTRYRSGSPRMGSPPSTHQWAPTSSAASPRGPPIPGSSPNWAASRGPSERTARSRTPLPTRPKAPCSAGPRTPLATSRPPSSSASPTHAASPASGTSDQQGHPLRRLLRLPHAPRILRRRSGQGPQPVRLRRTPQRPRRRRPAHPQPPAQRRGLCRPWHRHPRHPQCGFPPAMHPALPTICASGASRNSAKWCDPTTDGRHSTCMPTLT